MYLYLKALHIIFVVTWFAGLFYMPRLFIYNVEANNEASPAKEVLQRQFSIMIKRLWYGITWPSAIITLILGTTVMYQTEWIEHLLDEGGRWLLIKLGFVVFLYAYHLSLHVIALQQLKGLFKYSSTQLRIWNEVATIFLIAIVMLVVVKQSISLVWGLVGLVVLIGVLLGAIRLYKLLRNK